MQPEGKQNIWNSPWTQYFLCVHSLPPPISSPPICWQVHWGVSNDEEEVTVLLRIHILVEKIKCCRCWPSERMPQSLGGTMGGQLAGEGEMGIRGDTLGVGFLRRDLFPPVE